MRVVHTLAAHAVRYGIVLAAFLGAIPCLAQMAELRFQRLDSNAGLSHNSVYAITQDREGFLWFGTADGLNRYDGYEFRVFRHTPADPASLPNNLVLDLLAEEDGRLWVATQDGLSRFDPGTERFERFPLRAARAVFDLFEAHDGSVWAGSDAGAFRYDPVAGRFARAWPEPAGAPPVRVYGVRQDTAGDIWFLAGQRGDWRVVSKSRASGAVEELRLDGAWRNAHFDDFHIDENGRLWLAGNGPASIDAARRLARPPPGGDPAASEAWATLRSRDGTLWIGSAKGVFRIPSGADRGLLEILDHDRSGYIFNFVRSLYEDRAGTLWAGTHGGIYRADPHTLPAPGRPSRQSPRSEQSRGICCLRA